MTHGIEFGGSPPPPRKPVGKYAEVWARLQQNPGEWASKSFDSESSAQGFKQTMQGGAKRRDVRLDVATRRDSGRITVWFRVKEEAERSEIGAG
jgi:hypothetical protein